MSSIYLPSARYSELCMRLLKATETEFETAKRNLFQYGPLPLHQSMNSPYNEEYHAPLFHLAIECQNLKIVKTLLSYSGETTLKIDWINWADGDWVTPLCLAVKIQNLEIVKELLKDPRVLINPEDGGYHKTPHPLSLTVESGNCEIAQLLLIHPKINIKTPGKERLPPLSLAAKLGKGEMVKTLLKDPRIDPNGVDDDGLTPLHLAAIHSAKAVEALLSDSRVNRNPLNKKQETPFYQTVKLSSDVKIVQLFLDDPNVDVNNRNQSVVKGVLIGMFLQQNTQNTDEKAKLFLTHPRIDLNSVDEQGNSLLHNLCNHRFTQIEACWDRMNPNLQNKQGDTPFMLALENRNVPLAKMFLEKYPKIDWNVENEKRETALTLSQKLQDRDIFLFLKEKQEAYFTELEGLLLKDLWDVTRTYLSSN